MIPGQFFEEDNPAHETKIVPSRNKPFIGAKAMVCRIPPISGRLVVHFVLTHVRNALLDAGHGT